MFKYTVVIPTFNEEENIERCLSGISNVSEIIVVDSFSTDRTIEICKNNNIKVIFNKFKSHGEQIMYALKFVKNDWVFVLDADEKFSDSLNKELHNFLPVASNFAYNVTRENYFSDTKINFGTWRNDSPTRFFNKNYCHYNGLRVHASLICQGEVGLLKNTLFHYSYKNIDHYIRKIGRFSRGAAKDMYDIGKQTSPIKIVSRSLFRFLKSYILLRGYKDGKYGFFIALLESFYVALKYSMLLEMHIKTQQHK
jgi:glycosyltransferase involved in cell wall biosynthesis